jgi:hypothetical protein
MGVPQQQQEPVVAGGVPQQVIELTVEETLVSVLPEVIGKVSHVAAFQLTTPALALSTPYSKAAVKFLVNCSSVFHWATLIDPERSKLITRSKSLAHLQPVVGGFKARVPQVAWVTDVKANVRFWKSLMVIPEGIPEASTQNSLAK